MASAIVVFSHLRWNSVFRRPQHLMSTLAEHHPIIFIEDPVQDERASFLHTYEPARNILVCQPHTTLDAFDLGEGQMPALRRLLQQVARDHEEHVAWFYTPMALPLLDELQPRLVVYDSMTDVVRASEPEQWVRREHDLLSRTDIVFADSLERHDALRELHPNVHRFADSVDAAHFLPALDRRNSHPAHREIPGPRLGFHGVIDERFDTDLIGRLADAHPQWRIVLVGPVEGIDPASLPQRHNIHYLGAQTYESLPYFLAGWDVCLLPFTASGAAGPVSLSGALEYMAAELPVVATPAAGIDDAYADVIEVASDAPSFVAACEAALLAPRRESMRRAEKMRALLSATSWRRTAEGMRELLAAAVRRVDPADEARTDVASLHPLRVSQAAGMLDGSLAAARSGGLSAA